MADDATKVRVGVTGGVYKAPTGTTLPTNVTGALAAGFTNGRLGYLTEDGISLAINNAVQDIKAWQNGTVIRRPQTSWDMTVKFTAEELNPNTLAAFFGNYTAIDTTSGSSTINSSVLAAAAWVIEVIDGLAAIRIVLPSATITEHGEIPIATAAPISLPMTITAYPDTNGNAGYFYIDHDITAST